MKTKNPVKIGFAVRDCGLTDYQETLREQHELAVQRREGLIGDTVLLVEHQPVITLGARKLINKLLAGPEELAEKGISVVEIRRGGGATAARPAGP